MTYPQRGDGFLAFYFFAMLAAVVAGALWLIGTAFTYIFVSPAKADEALICVAPIGCNPQNYVYSQFHAKHGDFDYDSRLDGEGFLIEILIAESGHWISIKTDFYGVSCPIDSGVLTETKTGD